MDRLDRAPMTFVLTFIRILTAVVAPFLAVGLSILAAVHVRRYQKTTSHPASQCLRCRHTRPGSEAEFFFSARVGSLREITRKKHPIINQSPILGSETHFICDQCAGRYIHNEIIQQTLMSLAYPGYLFVLIPLFFQNGVFANFLIETLLVVMALAGATAAFDLYRAVKSGQAPLSEARDRVAIFERKKTLGKQYDYFTRLGRSRIDRKDTMV